MEQVFGYIERITFRNDETGYTVLQLKQPKSRDLATVVGILPPVQPGETIRCQGSWKLHLVHGRQFEVSSCQIEAPADIVGIKKYLGSGLIKGIGHTYAGRIVEKFGVDTLNVIDQTPDMLLEVEGLGKKRMEKIKTCWTEQKVVRDVMIFLQSYDVSPSYAQKVFKIYGKESIKVVKDNPYRMARDIKGVGFKSADRIAQKMGIAKESSQRVEAGIEYVLESLSEEGHVCYPQPEFLIEACNILEVPEPQVKSCLDTLHQEGRIEIFELVQEGAPVPHVWSKQLFTCEMGISRELKRLKKHACSLRQVDVPRALKWVQEELNIQLAPNQAEAVAQALEEKVQIITGGPGTGKSTITNAILRICEKLTPNIFLAAPTGRAAKRMCEITKKKASTIHSLLEVDFKAGGFKRNRQNPLECDLLIIDEASMIDTVLMYQLLRAIPSHARVIFVGDIHQLPSVGPGNVLKDLIASRMVPVTTLKEIFRQAAGSRIITNAHRINQGVFPDILNHPTSDFFFMEAETPEEVLQTILALATQRIPRKYGFHALKDIQVLAPMKKGIIGIENLNVVLQEHLNPQDHSIMRFGRKYQVGDKVMQIMNNYDKGVYNGDIGKILAINEVDQELSIQFDEQMVHYEFADLDELVLAYAVSVHKYQGSECPCIILPIHTTHFKLLHRNLLYTAVTRGKKLVILVGTKKALYLAVNNDDVKKRFTGLKQALIEAPIHAEI